MGFGGMGWGMLTGGVAGGVVTGVSLVAIAGAGEGIAAGGGSFGAGGSGMIQASVWIAGPACRGGAEWGSNDGGSRASIDGVASGWRTGGGI
jgi:hypothetical protein